MQKLGRKQNKNLHFFEERARVRPSLALTLVPIFTRSDFARSPALTRTLATKATRVAVDSSTNLTGQKTTIAIILVWDLWSWKLFSLERHKRNLNNNLAALQLIRVVKIVERVFWFGLQYRRSREFAGFFWAAFTCMPASPRHWSCGWLSNIGLNSFWIVCVSYFQRLFTHFLHMWPTLHSDGNTWISYKKNSEGRSTF